MMRKPLLAVLLGLLGALSLLSACGGEPLQGETLPASSGGKADSLQSGVPTLMFDNGWNEWADGTVVAGGKVAVDYDEKRLPDCRAWHNGNPGWQITAYVMATPSGTVTEAALFDYASGPTGPNYYTWVKQVPVLSVPTGTTELQVWFKNGSGFDHPCETWDSDFGKNYRFQVQKAAAGATLSFKNDWSIGQQGKLVAGGTVTVDYDPARLVAIANGPSSSYGYFASKYHCYGYGCCDHTYQNTLHVRFDSTGAFASHPFSAPVDLTIPAGATQIELYFDTDVTTEVWYCGSTPPGAKTTVGPDHFYDSNFGKNFVFGL